MIEDVLADVGVDGGERVVQQNDVTSLVDGAGQAHSLLLTAAEVDPLKSSVPVEIYLFPPPFAFITSVRQLMHVVLATPTYYKHERDLIEIRRRTRR